MRVKAIKLGYHGLTRRREGEVFDIGSEKEFSGKWMENVEVPAPVEKKEEKSAVADKKEAKKDKS